MAITDSSKTGKKQANPKLRTTSWKKGQSGNKNGRPSKGYSIAERMREMYTANPEKKDEIIEYMHDAVVLKMDVSAAKLLLSYVDGLPVQMKELSDNEVKKDVLRSELANELKAAIR